MSASPTLYIDPELPIHPAGATRADCRSFRRCAGFVGRKGHEVQCDWHPSAFIPAPRPPAPTADPAVEIVIVACGAQKAPGPAPLPELYTGPYFQACLRYARTLVTEERRIGVLSALHGLVPLSSRLMAYNTRLGDSGAVDQSGVRAQAKQLGILEAQRIVVLGGSAYVALARQVWPHAEAPLEGVGGIGKQLAWLRERSKN